MKLFSYQRHDNTTAIGVETEGGSINLSRAFEIFQKAKGIKPPVILDFLQVLVEMEYCSAAMLQQVLDEQWVVSKKEELTIPQPIKYNLPVARPSNIICIGKNYKAHAEEFGGGVPDEPMFFAKAPTSLIPHEASIVIPEWLTGRVDHEAELGVVIGKAAKDVSESTAMEYVAGYTPVNDVTARDIQSEDKAKGHPWFRCKSLDTFCPCGPFLVPVDAVDDPHKLDISLTVNGEEKQSATTADMVFTIPVLITHISKYMTLQPGDIIATGTPAGVSPLSDGDIIEISIAGIGTMRNSVVRSS